MTSPLHAPIAAAMGGLRAVALAPRWNETALDLAPFGHEVRFLDAVTATGWLSLYHRSNARSFPGSLKLPGWVLVDAYLLPSAIGLLVGKGRQLADDVRSDLLLGEDDDAIVAAYCALPCAIPRTVMGISLFSLSRTRGAGRAVKALTLGMLGAHKQRGLAQWSSASLRVHTRMGPLRVLGPSPEVHEEASRSFVYEVDLTDHARWAAHFAGTSPPSGEAIALTDARRLSGLAVSAYDGERIEIVPPGLSPDGTHVYVTQESERR